VRYLLNAVSFLFLLSGSATSPLAAEPAVPAGGFRILGTSAGNVSTQSMAPFKLGKWKDDDHLWWTEAAPGDKLDLELPVKADGRQRLSVVLTRAPDYAVVQFHLDGQKIGPPIDLYCAHVTSTPPVLLGARELSSGPHKVTVEIVGANEKAAKSHMFGLDRIILKSMSKESAPPAVESTAALDELHKLELLPRLRPGVRTKMFSSYDRTGGNNDGFSGVYSQLWIENGNSVLAKMDGPGCIGRIWFTHSEYQTPGLLNLKKEHIKVYLDGQEEPALDVPLEDLFAGKLPQFPRPLVGEGQGGYYCYVPIPYRDGCKLLVEGTGVRFYQITYREFPSADGVSSFKMEMSPDRQDALANAKRVWSNLGDLAALGLADAEETTVDLRLSSGSIGLELPKGPHMVRSVRLTGTAEQLKDMGDAGMQFTWDAAETPSADLPAEYFFGQALDPPPYRSLLVGGTDEGWYNFMPMPYRKGGSILVNTIGPASGILRVTTVPLDGWQDDLGYFHALYREELPTQPGRHHLFLRRSGRGHYAGTYLVTRGKTERKLPLWLEGDDRFTVDGRLAIHGTGSEDYFNCGWYAVEGRLNGPGGFPLHGFPVYRLTDDGENHAVAYRWHVTDPVAYEQSIVAEMEHGADNKLPADYRSAAFFYEPQP